MPKMKLAMYVDLISWCSDFRSDLRGPTAQHKKSYGYICFESGLKPQNMNSVQKLNGSCIRLWNKKWSLKSGIISKVVEQNLKSWIQKGGLDFCGIISKVVEQNMKLWIQKGSLPLLFCSTTFNIVPQKSRPPFLIHDFIFCSTRLLILFHSLWYCSTKIKTSFFRPQLYFLSHKRQEKPWKTFHNLEKQSTKVYDLLLHSTTFQKRFTNFLKPWFYFR